MAGVQLTETGDRTSRWLRAIVPNGSLASFAVSVACSYWIARAQSASDAGFARYLPFSRRIHCL
jgi:hypothetical protein